MPKRKYETIVKVKNILCAFVLLAELAGLVFARTKTLRSEQELPVLSWELYRTGPGGVVYDAMKSVAFTMSEDEVMENGGDDFMAAVEREVRKKLKDVDIEKSFVFDNRFYKWKNPLRHHEVAFYWKETRNWYAGEEEEYGFNGLTFDKKWISYPQSEFESLLEDGIKEIIPWQSQEGRQGQEKHNYVIPSPRLFPKTPSLFSSSFSWLTDNSATTDAAQKGDLTASSISLEENGDWLTLGLPNGRKMLLRKIPAGTFTSGSPACEAGHVSQSKYNESAIDDVFQEESDNGAGYYHLEDRLPHVVKIGKPFWIGKFETMANEVEDTDLEFPANNVWWFWAMDYCASLNKRYAKLLPNGYKFSLPLEEQWEYACRAGTTTALNDGTDLPKEPMEKSTIDTLAWYAKNTDRSGPSRPGLLRPNAWELYDMHGNQNEWCYDFVHSHPMLPGYPLEIYKSIDFNFSVHVMRGGGITSDGDRSTGEAIYCRSASRATVLGNVADCNGFRLALIPEELTPVSPSPFSEEQVAMRKATPAPARDGALCFRLPAGVTLAMEKVSEGEFLMGSPEDETGRLAQQYWHSVQGISSEAAEQVFLHTKETQRRVSVSHGFWLGRFSITRAQYAAVTEANLSLLRNPEHPMTQIRWEEAVAFCEKLNDLCKEQLLAGYRFAIPTEEQWEYACRAGTTTALNSGKDLTQGDFFCPNLAEVAWFQMNSGEHKRDVGLLKPNAWGLCDMHGNVWEWCVCTTPVDDNPLSKRILRGGSWYDPPRFCRSAMRRWLDEDRGGPDIGFRVALVPVESDGQQTEAKQ